MAEISVFVVLPSPIDTQFHSSARVNNILGQQNYQVLKVKQTELDEERKQNKKKFRPHSKLEFHSHRKLLARDE